MAQFPNKTFFVEAIFKGDDGSGHVMMGGAMLVDTEEWLFVTAGHVVKDAKEITVRKKSSGVSLLVECVLYSENRDLAILRLTEEELRLLEPGDLTDDLLVVPAVINLLESEKLVGRVHHTKLPFSTVEGIVSYPYPGSEIEEKLKTNGYADFASLSILTLTSKEKKELTDINKALGSCQPWRTAYGVFQDEESKGKGNRKRITQSRDEFGDLHPNLPLVQVQGFNAYHGSSGSPMFRIIDNAFVGLIIFNKGGYAYLVSNEVIIGFIDEYKRNKEDMEKIQKENDENEIEENEQSGRGDRDSGGRGGRNSGGRGGRNSGGRDGLSKGGGGSKKRKDRSGSKGNAAKRGKGAGGINIYGCYSEDQVVEISDAGGSGLLREDATMQREEDTCGGPVITRNAEAILAVEKTVLPTDIVSMNFCRPLLGSAGWNANLHSAKFHFLEPFVKAFPSVSSGTIVTKQIKVASGTVIADNSAQNNTRLTTLGALKTQGKAVITKGPGDNVSVLARCQIYLSSPTTIPPILTSFFGLYKANVRGNILVCGLHYNLAVPSVQMDSPVQPARLRDLDDIMSIHVTDQCHTDESQSFQFCCLSSLSNIRSGEKVAALDWSFDVDAFFARFSVHSVLDCKELYSISCDGPEFKDVCGCSIIKCLEEMTGIHEIGRIFQLVPKMVELFQNCKTNCGPWLGPNVTNLPSASLNFLEQFVLKFPDIFSGIIFTEVLENSTAVSSGLRGESISAM